MFADIFIRRPRLAMVIAILITLAGAIALDRLGRVGAACNTSRMVRAWIDGAGASGYGVESESRRR